MKTAAIHFMITIIVAIYGVATRAEGLGSACPSASARSIKMMLDFGCDIQLMADECKVWFERNPETLSFAKDCRKNDGPEGKSWIEACKEAGIENWTEILGLFSETAKAIEACDTDIGCKRKLARDAFFVCRNKDGTNQYPCTDSVQLADVYAGDLVRKRDKVRTLALQDSSYRIQLEKAKVPLPDGRERGVDLSLGLFQKIAQAKLRELGIKYDCYNWAGYAHMACYAIASVVDPTIVVGAPGVVLKGGKWASRVLRAPSLETGVKMAVRTVRSLPPAISPLNTTAVNKTASLSHRIGLPLMKESGLKIKQAGTVDNYLFKGLGKRKAVKYEITYLLDDKPKKIDVFLTDRKFGVVKRRMEELEKTISEIPAKAFQGTEKIEVILVKNRHNRDFGGRALMTGIEISPRTFQSDWGNKVRRALNPLARPSSSELDAVVAHELSHVLAQRHYGSYTPGEDYLKAMKTDEFNMREPDEAEDIAEFGYHYMRAVAGLKDPKILEDYRGRSAVWDKILDIDTGEREKIFEEVRSGLAKKGVYMNSSPRGSYLLIGNQLYFEEP